MSFALKRIPNEIRIVNYLLRKNYDLRIGRVILQLFCVAPERGTAAGFFQKCAGFKVPNSGVRQ